MPRPPKQRRICCMPANLRFGPLDGGSPQRSTVAMTIDEFEAIRLIDREGLTQEECAERMKVARTTVQMIYVEARRKLAICLVDGCALRIEGGHVRFCEGESKPCGGCWRQSTGAATRLPAWKGEKKMRIAVTYENGHVFQHFGHTEQFKVYDVEDGKVVEARVLSTEGSGHGALAGLLKEWNVEVLICGGIGGGAVNALKAAGIELYGGAMGDADQQIEAFLAGKLAYQPGNTCSHHDEHHGDCGGEHHHSCGH